MLLSKLMARVIASDSPRINRIYLCDAEYQHVMREADAARGHILYEQEDNRRVSLAGATCYRLSEIGR